MAARINDARMKSPSPARDTRNLVPGANNDRDDTGSGAVGSLRVPVLKGWEQDVIQSNNEVKRKAMVCQLCTSFPVLSTD